MRRQVVLSDPNQHLYEQIENLLIAWIHDGKLLPGSKIPSVREMSDNLKVSKSTVIQSYSNLEVKGYIVARPQSGFYVSINNNHINQNLYKDIKSKAVISPKFVQTPSLNLQYVQSCGSPDLIPLGGAIIDHNLLPMESLQKSMAKIARDKKSECLGYARLAGNKKLCELIAKRSNSHGIDINWEDLIVTNGCMEAINISLRATTKPGDVVAVESPTFYAFLRVIEEMSLKILEIPTNSKTGLDLLDFEEKLKKYNVKAAIFTPNFLNPLGSLMDDESKEKLVHLCSKQGVHLIEDDIYADLYFDNKRPMSLKSLDKKDEVFYCSSFSKTLSAGYRIGWVIPPKKFREDVELLKSSQSLATNSPSQLALADFLENNNYDRHLRRLRLQLEQNMKKMAKCVEMYFPVGTKITSPRGGCLLWVEFPRQVDSSELYRQALKQQISLIPGIAFSSAGNYKNCIRLNCGVLWNEKIEIAIKFIGSVAKKIS